MYQLPPITKPKTSWGFTLIEMSIVLVIVALLVGGVLVGRELIRQSQLRAVVSEIEKIRTATNAFKIKYAGLPGDVTNGTSFGFSANGDGNGMIARFPYGDTIGSYPGSYTEVWQFFKQLSEAGW